MMRRRRLKRSPSVCVLPAPAPVSLSLPLSLSLSPLSSSALQAPEHAPTDLWLASDRDESPPERVGREAARGRRGEEQKPPKKRRAVVVLVRSFVRSFSTVGWGCGGKSARARGVAEDVFESEYRLNNGAFGCFSLEQASLAVAVVPSAAVALRHRPRRRRQPASKRCVGGGIKCAFLHVGSAAARATPPRPVREPVHGRARRPTPSGNVSSVAHRRRTPLAFAVR
jgi:hypothetical protein